MSFFFILYGGPSDLSLHTILGPPDHFLRLLYGAPHISFFSYNMGAPLRSVSLFTIWAPPLRSVFFAFYRGATSHLSIFHNIYGGPLQISFFAYYMGGLSDHFLRLLYGGPLRSVSSLTI